LVNEVVKDSPAERAGLERGDIILEYDGQPVDELNDLPRLVAATQVGATVKVMIYRDGKERTVKVKIGKLDEGETTLAADDKEGGGALGITTANITPELVERYSLESDQGILITRIDPDGPAAEANLRVGDLIIEADGGSRGNPGPAAYGTVVKDAESGAVLFEEGRAIGVATNNVAAVLAFPIALSAADHMQVDVMPFAVTIMVAASASFATPIGYQTNLMVYNAGGYRFVDFVRIGLPLTLLVGLVTVGLVPLIWTF